MVLQGLIVLLIKHLRRKITARSVVIIVVYISYVRVLELYYYLVI